MIHVYAVVDRTDAQLRVAGIDAATVEVVDVGGLGVALSRHDSTSVPPSTDAVVAHAGVCDALLASGCAVLPVRFGARYADDAALCAAVEERAPALLVALKHVHGRVEIGLRAAAADSANAAGPTAAAGDVTPRAADRHSPDTGTDYLHRRRDEEHARAARREAARAVAARLHDDLSARAADAHLKVLATPGLLLSAAYLVEADEVDDFTRAVARHSAARPDLQLLCTGPWPAYHFAGEAGLA